MDWNFFDPVEKAIDKAQLTPVQEETIKGLGHKIEFKFRDKN
jgi:hypothetical protein